VNAQLIRDAYRKNLIGDLASSNSSHNNNNGGGSSLRPSRASSLADSGHHQPAGQGQGVGAGGGGVCPKSPLGRPNADGPWCLVRGPHEHVSVFRAREVDRAHKNKDLDPEFKVVRVFLVFGKK
jgi:hypothetical protein